MMLAGVDMGKVLKGLGAVAVGAFLACLMLYAVSRWIPMPRADAEALARVEASASVAGTNGSAALWALPYAVPLGQAERLLAADVARFAASPVQYGENTAVFALQLESLPRLDGELAERGNECRIRETGCLRMVRAALPYYERTMVARGKIASRIAALDDYDHFRNPFPARVDMPIPAYQLLTRNLSSHAHAFVRGDKDMALQSVCQDASIARKLVSSGDNLIGSMIGVAMMEGTSRLYIEMLAELPAEYPVPAKCGEVFNAGSAMAAGICTTMMGEGRYSVGVTRSLGARVAVPSRIPRLFYDVEKSAARGASMATWFCGGRANGLVAVDAPLQDEDSKPPIRSFQCVANAVGCLLGDMNPGYGDYALRLQDAGMRQKLVSSWLWLRAHSGDTRPMAERLASRPTAMKSPARDIRIGKDGKSLAVEMYYDGGGRNADWQLPVPEWMADTAAR